VPTIHPVSPVTGLPEGSDGYPWWNDTVFYEIFVRSFYDSDGDGIGDFNGIIEKLDYLNDGDPATHQDLGITGIWLMPINPSPSYHGYDVTNYQAVNPEYGTMEDFKRLVDECHARSIRVIIDLVLNHTSSRHAWFVAAQDPASPYRDYYIWAETRPEYYGPWGQNVWYRRPSGYYYALFWEHMPDLNYANPQVTLSMENAIAFWLTETGVDGFRLDAARHLIEDGADQENTPATHLWYGGFRLFYKNLNPAAVTVGEIWDDTGSVSEYIQGDELDLAFEFNLAEAFIASANQGNAYSATGQVRLSYRLLPDLQFATFLTNHDIDRVYSQLGADPDKARVAASLLLTAPGVPFIYYGEELGMQGTGAHENIRRPMQWSAERTAGFSTDFPWISLGPDWETNNVASETADPDSLLSHYRMLIQLRNDHAALRVGDLRTITTLNPGVYSILRVSQEEAVMVIINLTSEPVSDYRLTLENSALVSGTYLALPLLGTGTFTDLTALTSGGFSNYIPLEEIPPYATIILQLQIK